MYQGNCFTVTKISYIPSQYRKVALLQALGPRTWKSSSAAACFGCGRIETRFAIALAVVGWSPVTMTTCIGI
jgi:hypothetical protein